MVLSRLRSATRCLSFRFSSRSWRSSRTSGVPSSPNFFFCVLAFLPERWHLLRWHRLALCSSVLGHMRWTCRRSLLQQPLLT